MAPRSSRRRSAERVPRSSGPRLLACRDSGRLRKRVESDRSLRRRRQALKEALELAGELHNQVLIAQTLNYQGEDAWYRGDVSAARSLFDRRRRKPRARPIAAFSC